MHGGAVTVFATSEHESHVALIYCRMCLRVEWFAYPNCATLPRLILAIYTFFLLSSTHWWFPLHLLPLVVSCPIWLFCLLLFFLLVPRTLEKTSSLNYCPNEINRKDYDRPRKILKIEVFGAQSLAWQRARLPNSLASPVLNFMRLNPPKEMPRVHATKDAIAQRRSGESFSFNNTPTTTTLTTNSKDRVWISTITRSSIPWTARHVHTAACMSPPLLHTLTKEIRKASTVRSLQAPSPSGLLIVVLRFPYNSPTLVPANASTQTQVHSYSRNAFPKPSIFPETIPTTVVGACRVAPHSFRCWVLVTGGSKLIV